MSPDSSDDTTIRGDGRPTRPDLQHPERLGPYRIRQVIGEGGMGVVYDAEQTEPVRRRVAVKMMKIGMDTREVVARFEAERQALAVMDHPNIARVLDAGASESGRPYFVMELVHGLPITEYCDRNRLSTRARLELFIPICHAVQHAHQKGVIHRDLKPSNVLVTDWDGQPLPKIIDFGIAKAIARPLTERTLVTELGQTIGTPAYMSPEQAELTGLDVDTRSDIYSLGVMLYELLVGGVPLDPARMGAHEFLDRLRSRETDPPKPSTRLSSLGDDQRTVARSRATDPRALVRELKGDLDWIVMKAMDRDRSRRYDTAGALAEELRRYLDREPVQARPPSATYRFRKFVRRHTAGVAFGAILALMVLAFAISMAVQAGLIARERDRAEQEAAKARAVNDFMKQTLLAPDPIEGLGREVTVAEALSVAASRLDRAFPDQPEVEATARAAVGWAYFQMGRYDEAEPLLRQALEMRRRTIGPAHADLAESLDQWGRLEQVRTRYDSAEAHYREALAMQRSVLGPDHPAVAASLEHLGILLGELGRYAEAEAALEEALTIQGAHDPESLAHAEIQNQIGVLLWNQGEFERLEPLWDQVLAARRRQLGDEHPLVAESMNNLAVLYDNTDRPDEAERLYREALAIQQKALGPEHEEVSAAMANLAILLDGRGEYEEAEQLYREALRIDRKQLGDDNPAVANDLVNLASMLCQLDRADEGVPLLDEALATFSASIEPGNWRTGNTLRWRGHCLTKLRRYAEAERDLLSGLDILGGALGAEHWRVEQLRQQLDELYAAWGRPGPDAR